MGATNSESKQTKYYSLFGKASDKETPAFQLSKKVNGAWAKTQSFDTMKGWIAGASIQEKEYQGAKFNVFVLTMQDDQELSKITMTHSSLSYSIINTLCSNTNNDMMEVEIKVYKKHDTAKGKYFPGAIVYKLGNKLGWKYPFDQAPKATPITLPNGQPFMQNGKQVYDDTAIKAYWEDKFKTDIVSQFNGAMKPNQNFENKAAHLPNSAPISQPQGGQAEEESDLLF